MDNTERVPIGDDILDEITRRVNSLFEILDVAKQLANFVKANHTINRNQDRFSGCRRDIYWLLQDAKRVGLL